MIDKKLLNDIKQFCEINNIKDVKKFINNLLLESFNKLRFGSTPFQSKNEKPSNNNNDKINNNIADKKTTNRIQIIKTD